MKHLIYLVLFCTCFPATAGSLGKYQSESPVAKPTFSAINNAARLKKVPVRPKKTSRKKATRQEFYANFSRKTAGLAAGERKQMLNNYKNSLNNALGRSPVNIGEVNHYTKLIDILQTKKGG